MAGGAAAPARIRIKGRKQSVFRFFLISVAYTITWITLSSELGYYSKLYGPNVLLLLNIAYYLPSIPVLILSGHIEKMMDARFGHCQAMFIRLTAGMIGCGFVSAYFPFLPFSLEMLLGMVMLLGATSAVAFSTSYQIVAWFRAADTISLGLGCVGSGPLVLLIQLVLGTGSHPSRWQWICMFEIAAGLVVVGILCELSLLWQYGRVISGKEEYVDIRAPLLGGADAGASGDPNEGDDDEPPPHLMVLMLSPRVMSIADPFSGMPLVSYRRMSGDLQFALVLGSTLARDSSAIGGSVTKRISVQAQPIFLPGDNFQVLAAPDYETGMIRPVRRAASVDSEYSLATSTHLPSQPNLLRVSKSNHARSNRPYTHYVSPPTAGKPIVGAGSQAGGWEDHGSGHWRGFPELLGGTSETPHGTFTAVSPARAYFVPSNLSSLSRVGSDASLSKPASDPEVRVRLADTFQPSSDDEEPDVAGGAGDFPGARIPSLAVSLAKRTRLQAAGVGSPHSRNSIVGSIEEAGGGEWQEEEEEEEDDDERDAFSSGQLEDEQQLGSGFTVGSQASAHPNSAFEAVQRPAQGPPAAVPRLPSLPLPLPVAPGSDDTATTSATMEPSSPDVHHEEPGPAPPLKQQPSELEMNLGVFKDLWTVILGSLAGSTINNLVFPFFTYVPTSGLLGDYLPQALFFTRIFADITGRLLPRVKVLAVHSPYLLLVIAMTEACIAVAFFFYIKCPPQYHHDLVSLAAVAFFWLAGGFINTNSYILAPNLVPPRLCARASAIMALTYQVAHFLGLMLAIVLATVLYGNITGGL